MMRVRRKRGLIDQVYGYFLTYPNIVHTPRKVAKELGIKYNVAVTILNRLVQEKSISKVDRGKFILRKAIIDETLWREIYRLFLESAKACFGNSLVERIESEVRRETGSGEIGKENTNLLIRKFSEYFGRSLISALLKSKIRDRYKDRGEEIIRELRNLEVLF